MRRGRHSAARAVQDHLARRRRMSLVVGAVVALAIGVGAGAAYGFVTADGSGSGSTHAGNVQVVSLAAITSETPDSLLQPGSSAEVIIEVHNPNALGVTLTSVAANGPITVSGGVGCTLGNSGVTFTGETNLSIPVAASTTTLVRLPGAAAMSTTSVSGCQGATFAVPVTITVHEP